MAAKKTARNARPASTSSASETRSTAAEDDRLQSSVVAFAEHVGQLLGTVSAKTESRLDRKALGKTVAQIRDRAAEFVEQVNAKNPLRQNASAASGEDSTPRRSRGLVDAPGKKHRQPPPQQRVPKHMTGPMGGQSARAAAKTGRRGMR